MFCWGSWHHNIQFACKDAPISAAAYANVHAEALLLTNTTHLVMWCMQVNKQELESCMGLRCCLLPATLHPPGLWLPIVQHEAILEGPGSQLACHSFHALTQGSRQCCSEIQQPSVQNVCTQ